jgi:hypothetical protein
LENRKLKCGRDRKKSEKAIIDTQREGGREREGNARGREKGREQE